MNYCGDDRDVSYMFLATLKIMAAKQKSFIKLKGSLGGLTFYDKNGENIVKTLSVIERDRILKDPAFKRTRENMAEFGGSATVGKALRTGLATVLKTMSDSTTVGRITGLMKQINSAGAGARGKRSFEILNNKQQLEGFEFNKSITFGSIFYAPFVVPTLDANRSVCTWTVPDFNIDSHINAPEGATHFKLVLVTSVLSDYAYNNNGKGYAAVNPIENETSAVAISDAIVLGGMVGNDTSLVADLGFANALPATVGVVSSIGIVFYQEINGVLYELASNNAMRIEAVG